MIIKGKNLQLHYYDRKAWGYGNLREIEREEFGFDLQVGQKVAQARYSGVGAGREIYITPVILDINDKGLVLQGILENEGVFCPWEKSFPTYNDIRGPATGSELCCLMVFPCDDLYEANRMVDILNGNIVNEVVTPYGTEKGIWYQHGGSRTWSRFESNLQSFVQLTKKRNRRV